MSSRLSSPPMFGSRASSVDARACACPARSTASRWPFARSWASASRFGPRPRSPAGWPTGFGEPIETPYPGLNRLSPTPARLAAAEEPELRALGIIATRVAAIRALAQAVTRREIDLEPGPDPEIDHPALKKLPGIGDWTAQYIAMRACAGRTPSPPPTWSCSRRRARRPPTVSSPRPKHGGPGELTRPCTCGKANTRSKRRSTMNEHARSIYSTCPSPFGDLFLISDGDALTGLYLPQHDDRPAPGPEPGWLRDDAAFRAVRDQLRAYFAGELREFELPLRMKGTDFQRLVWKELIEHPVRNDHQLCRAGPADRTCRRGPRGRSRQRAQPHRDRGSLPPGDRRQWNLDRLWRRSRPQAMAARSRGDPDRSREEDSFGQGQSCNLPGDGISWKLD